MNLNTAFKEITKVNKDNYKCPICDEIFSKYGIKNHIRLKHTEDGQINYRNNMKKIKEIGCKYCGKKVKSNGIKNHERYCYLNPSNYKECPVCGKPIKNYSNNITCSHSCANTYSRSGTDNGNWSNDSYRTTCFMFHKKECVVCGEDILVEVHHLDENKSNNNPSNLIPLCPTHHKYWHSRHKHLIHECVIDYVYKFKEQNKEELKKYKNDFID
jgi:predicted nucleic acid-binding Zn ribbon protein/DNA-directed RNA polymerase subunit RPC12/RpoP